jgi:hypothetical protein
LRVIWEQIRNADEWIEISYVNAREAIVSHLENVLKTFRVFNATAVFPLSAWDTTPHISIPRPNSFGFTVAEKLTNACNKVSFFSFEARL